jgi:hypothetical protein
MPRLGGNDKTSPRLRNAATTFAQKLSKLKLRNIAFVVIVLFLLRNFFTLFEHTRIGKDVGVHTSIRKDVIDPLQTKITVKRPQDIADTKKNMRTKKDTDTRELGLREMDQIHEEKRKRKEEQLMKEHPDFKTSRRVRTADMATA